MNTIVDYTKLPKGFVEKVLNFAFGIVGVKDVNVTVGVDEAFLQKMSPPDMEYEGILVPSPLSHTYILRVKDVMKGEMLRILAHEAVHISQQERGDLKVNPDTLECRWKGEKYTNDYPYMDRPWEKEAFKTQAEILKAYRASEKQEKLSTPQPGCALIILLFLILSISLWML